MANHPNRGAATVHLDADWTPYTDAIPQGSIALGTVTQGQETGALVFIEDTQDYWMIQPRRIHKLNARKVKAAIHQAQPVPTTPEP
jgi:hypothetical protein